MRKKIAFTLSLCLSLSNVMAVDFLFTDLSKDKGIFQYRKDIFSSVFSENVLNWEKNGLYIFWERGEVSKLFFVDSEKSRSRIVVYQLPLSPMSLWLNPDQRGGDFLTNDYSRCQIEMSVDSVALKKLNGMSISRLPYMFVEKGIDYNDDLIFGFVKNETIIDYFSFRDVRRFKTEIFSQIEDYIEIFDYLDALKIPFMLDGCR